jgi:phage gp37-like protein
MSVLLMSKVKVWLRSEFTTQEVLDVQYYGGEFSAEEVQAVSYPAPCIMLAGLGWYPPRGKERMSGSKVRVVRLAAFVVTSQGSRTERMLSAQALAEKLDLKLHAWVPSTAPGDAVEVAAVEPESVRCENVYNRRIDAKGQALWLVTWHQCVTPLVPAAQIYDLLSVDIESTNTLPFEATPDAGEQPIAVTHGIEFQPSN